MNPGPPIARPQNTAGNVGGIAIGMARMPGPPTMAVGPGSPVDTVATSKLAGPTATEADGVVGSAAAAAARTRLVEPPGMALNMPVFKNGECQANTPVTSKPGIAPAVRNPGG